MKVSPYSGMVFAVMLFFGLTRTDCSEKPKVATKQGPGKSMTSNDNPIPFRLTLAEGQAIRILYTLYSPKTGAGKQAIEVSGSGQVRVIRTANIDAPEEIVIGKVPEGYARTLFSMIESEGFLKLDENYKSGGISGREHLLLTLPGREKSVYSDYDSAPPDFEKILGGIKLIAGIYHPQGEPPKMKPSVQPLPFGLTPVTLLQARIFIEGYSPKTGAGKERIEIFGTGEVRLIRTDNYKAPEESVSVKVRPSDVAALLTLMESEGFMQMDSEYKGNSVYSLRTQVNLQIPTAEKSVYADDMVAPPKFERMVGAIKVLAGLASPLALNRQYFFRL